MHDKIRVQGELTRDDGGSKYQFIYDDPGTKAFELLTGIMRRVFRVPVAVVSLVDDTRVYHLPNISLLEHQYTDKEKSICSLPFMLRETIVIEDLERDEDLSFKLYEEYQKGIRFFAGVPVTSVEGKLSGAVCLMDTKPGKFSLENKELLQEFAKMTANEIDLMTMQVNPQHKEKEGIQFNINDPVNSSIVEQAFNLFLQAPVPISIYKGKNHTLHFTNEISLQISRKTKDIIGKPLIEIAPEVEAQGYIALLDKVLETGIPFRAIEAPVTIVMNENEKLIYVDLIYQPLLNNVTGEVEGIMSIANDVTEQVKARKIIEESEQRFRNVLEQAPIPILILKGEDMVLEVANGAVLKLWNVGPEAIGKPFLEILPEMKDQGYYALLQNVYRHGISHTGFETPVYFIRQNGEKELHYFNFNYAPFKEKDGLITGVLVHAIDVTEKINARQKIAETQENFHNLVMQAPVGICILQGDDFKVELANDSYLEIVQRKRELFVGKPLWEVLPEVKNQGFDKILENVLKTNSRFEGNEYKVKIQRLGKEETLYVDFVYEPMREIAGPSKRIMVLAFDITDKVMARKKIEEAEESSRLAIEAAELGTFEVNLFTNEVTSSPRLDEILDMEPSKERSQFVNAIHPEDLLAREAAYKKAYETGILEYEARVVKRDQSIIWMRAKGKIYFTENRIPYRLLGVIQDITQQKLFYEELAKQVRDRTLELSIANQQLQRSNKELEQFAYISSHDLQEPLRKIKMFSGLILEKDGMNFSDFSKTRFLKVIDAADRMSRALRDLLNYASLGNEQKMEQVNLNEVLKNVEMDLELLITQKVATIEQQVLPVVRAIPLQMHQLFYNLLNNALKFSKEGVPPLITISASRVDKEEIDGQNLYEIRVQDNGIGFEKTGSEKIFTIFQSLHDRTKYDGTGIGLALCKKVVENHHGTITADSIPGEGSTFIISMPA